MHKMIGGLKYEFKRSFTNKKEASKFASSQRSKGKLARVIYGSMHHIHNKPVYSVWVYDYR